MTPKENHEIVAWRIDQQVTAIERLLNQPEADSIQSIERVSIDNAKASLKVVSKRLWRRSKEL